MRSVVKKRPVEMDRIVDFEQENGKPWQLRLCGGNWLFPLSEDRRLPVAQDYLNQTWYRQNRQWLVLGDTCDGLHSTPQAFYKLALELLPACI